MSKTSALSFSQRLNHFFLLLRVSQWTKAAFVMLGFCYTQTRGYLISALLAALAFCFISSVLSIYNDIEDKTGTNVHLHKHPKGLANERVSSSEAIFILFLLLLLGLTLGWILSKKLAMILCCYLLINIAYTHLLKLIPIIDVLCIAAGFILSVLAGTVGIGLSSSIWLIITTLFLSLFIALNQTKMEMQLDFRYTRRLGLKKYNPLVLHWLIVTFGWLSFLAYFLYTIYAQDESFYFMLTLPFAAIALWRFALLATQDVGHDDPIIVFLMDKLSRINLWCFIVLTFMALA